MNLDSENEWIFESNRTTYEDSMGDSEFINIVEHRIRAFKIAVQKLMN